MPVESFTSPYKRNGLLDEYLTDRLDDFISRLGSCGLANENFKPMSRRIYSMTISNYFTVQLKKWS